MHCSSCATIINKALTKTPGIKEANVNFSSGKAYISFDENKIKEEKILEIIKQKGYGATIGD